MYWLFRWFLQKKNNFFYTDDFWSSVRLRNAQSDPGFAVFVVLDLNIYPLLRSCIRSLGNVHSELTAFHFASFTASSEMLRRGVEQW